MDKKGSEKQRCITICREIIEFLKKDDVLYSIREDNRDTNIHVEWEHCVGEHLKFTIAKTYSKMKRKDPIRISSLKIPRNPTDEMTRTTEKIHRKISSGEPLENLKQKNVRLPTKENMITKSSYIDADADEKNSKVKNKTKGCRTRTIDQGLNAQHKNSHERLEKNVDISLSNEDTVSYKSIEENTKESW